MMLIKEVSSSIVLAFFVTALVAMSAQGADLDLPPEDPEARAMFERFASMYAGLERYHERAVSRMEIVSEIQMIKKFAKEENEAWEFDFLAPNLLRLNASGQEIVSDGERIVALNPMMGFYVEKKVNGNRNMLSALEDLSGKQQILPPTIYWLVATRRSDVFRYFGECSFTDSGAEKLDGIACVWIDVTWEQSAGFGQPELLVDGRFWFAAETGRLRRLEVDTTEMMNNSMGEMFAQGFIEMPRGHRGALIERALSITEIVESDTQDQIQTSIFIIDDPTGLKLSESLSIGAEEARREMRWGADFENQTIKVMIGEQNPGFSGTDIDGEQFDLSNQHDEITLILFTNEFGGLTEKHLDDFNALAHSYEEMPVESFAAIRLLGPRDRGPFGDFFAREDLSIRIVSLFGMDKSELFNKIQRDSVVLIDMAGVVQAVYELDPKMDLPRERLINDVNRLLNGERIYDELAVNARREKRRIERELHEQAAPLLPLDDVRPDSLTLERASANTGFVIMSNDFNGDGVDDMLLRTKRQEFFLIDGRTNTNTEIRLEGISRADQPHISHLLRTPTGPGLLVWTTTNDPRGDSVSTIGVFDLDGRKRWRRTLGPSELGIFTVGMPHSVAGDLNGDGFDEIAVLILKIENDRPHNREIRLVVLDAAGAVIVSKELDEQVRIRFVGADRPGKRGWITYTSSSGVYRLMLDYSNPR